MVMFHDRLDETNFEDTGNEYRYPPLSEILKLKNLIPLTIYFIFFRVLSYIVQKYTWNNTTGFKQYRLHNLTTCLIHSILSGSTVLAFSFINPFAMFVEPMQWYQDWSRHILLFSISYFVHDTYDMLKFEISRFTAELILHHICSSFAFIAVVTARKFIPFAFLALLMEVNSIWLHIRTLMQLSGQSTKHPIKYKIVQFLNIITFIIVRFGVQGWQAHWITKRRHTMHMIWYIIGIGGCLTFLIINGCLFMRVLASDGYLGEFGRKHAAINRDDPVKKDITEKEQ